MTWICFPVGQCFMIKCPFSSRTGPFHDGELDPVESRQFEAHLRDCPACADMLESIRQTSRLLSQTPVRPLSQIGMARLHQTAELAARKREVFPLAKALLAVAASVLVICGAWLKEMPSQNPSPASVVKIEPPAEWERLAAGGSADLPSGTNDDQTGLALNWMNQGLR